MIINDTAPIYPTYPRKCLKVSQIMYLGVSKKKKITIDLNWSVAKALVSKGSKFPVKPSEVKVLKTLFILY